MFLNYLDEAGYKSTFMATNVVAFQPKCHEFHDYWLILWFFNSIFGMRSWPKIHRAPQAGQWLVVLDSWSKASRLALLRQCSRVRELCILNRFSEI